MATDRLKSVDKDTRQAVAASGGRGRKEAVSPERRSEIAAAGAAKANSAPSLALRIRRQWPTLKIAERRAVAEALSGCKGLGVVPMAPGGMVGPRKSAPRKVVPIVDAPSASKS
jgi:hypothetical protein